MGVEKDQVLIVYLVIHFDKPYNYETLIPVPLILPVITFITSFRIFVFMGFDFIIQKWEKWKERGSYRKKGGEREGEREKKRG